MIDKLVGSFDEAVADVSDGACVMFGGFALPHNNPSYLIAALARRGTKDLAVIAASSGHGQADSAHRAAALAHLLEWPVDDWDLGILSEQRLIRHSISSFPSGYRRAIVWPFERLLEEGFATAEVTSQGTLAERIRCAKAGIAGFYTPVGVGTAVAEDKEVRDFNGVPYLFERALGADFAMVRAHRADRLGNLVYRGAPTYNTTMAGAATVTIAEVDEVVEAGVLAPDRVQTPGVYVQRVVVRPHPPRHAWEEPC